MLNSSRSSMHAKTMSATKALIVLLMLCCLKALGATLDAVTVAPSGGDYTSLSNWEAGEDDTGNLTTRDVYQVVTIDGTWSSADVGAVNIDGWTCDATRYISIVTSSTARHQGKWATSRYVLSASAASTTGVLLINEPYTRVTGIQLEIPTPTASEQFGIRIGAGGCLVDSCIIQGKNDSDTYQCGIVGYSAGGGNGDSTLMIRNCVFYNVIGSTTDYGFYNADLAYTLKILNCTAYNCYFGYQRDTGTFGATNCIAQSCNNGFNGTITQVTCVSDIAGDANTQATTTFTDAANGDFHTTDSDVVDHGTDLSAIFTTDIDGETRSGTWDIGADEYVAAAGGFVPSATPIQRVIFY